MAVYLGMNTPTVITNPLRSFIDRTFKLNPHGIHGHGHWDRVLIRGLELASATGASLEVVTYFAYLHDLCRENEGSDPKHGQRSAKLLYKLRSMGLVKLDDRNFNRLRFAIHHHSEGLLKADVTVMTCWDADRLDLGRCLVSVDPQRLCTDAARNYLMTTERSMT